VAQHASALKRHRQSEKRRIRNKDLRTRLKHAIREARTAIAAKNATTSATVAAAVKALDKAVAKGVVHRNTAARKTSRLAKAAHAAAR